MAFGALALFGGVYAFSFIGIGAFDAVLIEVVCLLAYTVGAKSKKVQKLEAEIKQLREPTN